MQKEGLPLKSFSRARFKNISVVKRGLQQLPALFSSFTYTLMDQYYKSQSHDLTIMMSNKFPIIAE